MSAVANEILEDMEQGTSEWHALRKTKITATDACAIMRVSPWKTRMQLYEEKISDSVSSYTNTAMQRGLDLEPIARDLFWLKTAIDMQPKVVIKEWAMASLDGISACGRYILEIKCPGEVDHEIALNRKIPDHYYPQLQHQMYVCDVHFAYYFSFKDGDGVIVEVPRDDEYIEKMLIEEKKFYECLVNKTAPAPESGDYIERDDTLWNQCASQYKNLVCEIEQMEKQKEELRKQLVFLSGESNTKGGGISLCQIQRKGNIDYLKIPELKGLDLEKYRKPPTNNWRVTCH